MKIEIEREQDGRWIVEVPNLSGVMAYGKTRKQAIAKAEALALRVIADRLDHGEAIPELQELFAMSAGAGGLPLKRSKCWPLFFVSVGWSSGKPPVLSVS